MKRHTPAAGDTPGEVHIPDKDWEALYPHICSYLCDAFYDDGKRRKLGSLGVRMGDSVLVTLTDPDRKSTGFTSAASVEEALGLMEQALADNRFIFKKWKD